MSQSVTITINGVKHTHEVEPRLLLVHFIRELAGLTGTHDSRARIIGPACCRPDAGRQQTSTWSATNTW